MIKKLLLLVRSLFLNLNFSSEKAFTSSFKMRFVPAFLPTKIIRFKKSVFSFLYLDKQNNLTDYPTRQNHGLFKTFIVSIVFLFSVSIANATNYFSRATGNWTSNTTWSLTSGGASVGAGVFPTAGDVVFIEGGFNVTLNANAACTSISFPVDNNNNNTLTLAGFTLAVSGNITIPRANNGGSGYKNLIAVGSGNLNAGSISFTNAGTSVRHEITISTGTVSVTGDILGSTSNTSGSITFTGAGLLKVGGAMFLPADGTLTTFAGSTVEYNGGAQTVSNFTYSNLTLSGSGTKTISTNIAGITNLTVSGTAILAPNAANRIPDATKLILNGGSYSTGGFSETMGTVALNDNSTIALGAANHTINLASSNGVTWVAGKILTITGWTGVFGSSARIFVGNSATSLTASQLAQIKFQVGAENRNATILATGEVVPAFCPFAGNTQSGGTQSICYDSTVRTTGTITGGVTFTGVPVDRYVAVNVIEGMQYRIATTAVNKTFIKRLTLFKGSSTTTSLATTNASSATTAASIDWTANFTGVLYVVFNTANCQTSAQTDDITISYIGGNNTADSQNAFGTDSWIGHVYNFSDTAGVSPLSDMDAFVNYLGYFNQANTVSGTTLSFTKDYNTSTSNATCFPFTAVGTSQSFYTETFAVRYKMQTTPTTYPAGCYFVSVKGDDGVRLYIDGVLVFDAWVQQSGATYDNVLVYLTGNSKLIFDYYEKNGDNVSNFTITPAGATINSLNTITPTGPVVRCINTATVLTGSSVATQGSNSIAPVQYQWQSSNDNLTWNDIPTATGQSYTVPGTTPTAVTQIYYRRIVKGSTTNSAACLYGSNVVAIVTSPNTTTTVPTSTGATNVSCTSFTANWNSVPTATSYKLDVSTSSTFASFVINGLDVGLVTSYNINSLTNGTTYYYRVRAFNGCSNSPSGNSGSQTVIPVSPTATISGTTSVCLGAASPNITFTNPLSNAITVTYNINSGTNATINVAANATVSIAAPTSVSGSFVYNLVSAVYQSSPTCSSSLSGSAIIMVNSTPTITLNKTNETCASSNNGTITPVLSGGLTNIKSIRLTQKYVDADAWQQVGEIQAVEIFTGTNVALASNGANATSSSIYANNAGVYGPLRAIDGDPATLWHSNSVNINEYIKVDLASAKNLDYLRIYNRSDCCQQRGQNMLLELLDASNNVVYSKTVDLFGGVTTASHYIDINVLDVSWNDGVSALNRTGLDNGTYTLNYSDGAGCSTNPQANIGTTNPDAAITSVTGPGSVCIGGATTAYTANGVVLGGGTGAWSSTSPLIATVDASGNVTGVAAGTTDIVYTITGGCSGIKSALKTITVNSNAAITSVTGPGSVCIGGATTAYTANGVVLGGGTGAWSSTSPLIATVDASGNVTGVAAGTTNIVYTITGGCSGIKSAQINVTVNANLSPIAISPAGSQSLCATNSGTLLSVSETGGGTITRQWGKRSTTGGTITNISGATGTTYTPTGVDLGVGNWLVVCTSTPTCGTARVSNEVAVTVNANINASVTIAAVPSGAICSGTSVTFTATPVNPGTAPTYQWYKGSAPISSATGSTYTTTTLGNLDAISVQMISNATPCLTGSPATSNLITMTVNSTPTAPTASVTTQPTCAAPTGTITVSSPAEGTGFTYSINGTDYFPTAVFNNVLPSNTPYSVTTTNSSGCISPATLVTVNTPSGKVWNGSQNSDWTNALNWTPAVVPVLSDCVIVPSTVNKPEIASGASVTVHSITVSSGGLLTVRSKASLTVVTSVNVATGGDLVFEDDSSLLQTSTDNTINTGNITYNRISAPVRRYDFTFWSSPVTRTPTAYTLSDVSPLTLFDKYYSFSPTTGWVISYSGILPMTPGLGYIIRAPQTYDITNAVVYPATFVGKPNNGTIEVTGAITSKSILLGNPYPSGLNAIKFINYNHTLGTDVGTLYFWTHNSPPSDTVLGDGKYNYTTADYAAFNLTGTVGTKAGTDTSNNIPTGIIAAGQAFFIRATSSGIITFTNDMRVGPGNDQFFKLEKANNEDKNRIWLNLSNNEGAFKQTLIGYLDGATNNWDINYDGTTLSGNSYVDFYSINDAKKLTVQGRAMPFDNTDLVPLGYMSSIAGDFTIAIDHGDGFFDTQAVYLEDKTTGKTVDLRAGNYTFTTAIGTFTDRFVLSYTNKTLGTGDFEKLENGLLVAVKEKTIKITSAKEAIKEVTIYDVNGKLLYNKKKIASTDLQVSNLQAANQVLLVKVILENEFTTTRKIIFQ